MQVLRMTPWGPVLQDGMQVTFSEVIGIEELNNGRPRKVKNCKVCQSTVHRCLFHRLMSLT